MIEKLKERIYKMHDAKVAPYVVERIDGEINLIGEDILKDIIKVKNILEDNFFNTYSFSGTINSFYVAYLLGIIKFNPNDYMIPYSNYFTFNINIKEDCKELLFNLIKEELPYIKKVSNISNDNNQSYSGFIIDKENSLSTYKTGIVKIKKRDLIHKYLVINIYEKMTLTLLDKMFYGNEEAMCFFNNKGITSLKSKFNENLINKLPFEYILNDLEDTNLHNLINKNICFNIKYIDHLILEYKLCYFKYNFKKTYYINYLKYLLDKVDKKVIYKYKNNYQEYFLYNQDELTYEYIFYSLLSDASNEKLELNLDFNHGEVKLYYQNIYELKFNTIKEKFNYISKYIHSLGESDEIDIFGFSGNDLYYLSNMIASDIGEDAFKVESYINPLRGAKPIFNKDFYSSINEEKYLKSIHFYRNNNIFLHTDYKNDDDILNYIIEMCNSGTTKIILDGIKMTDDLYKELNKLNKEIYILHKIEGIR